VAAAEAWVSGGCGGGLGFWRLPQRLGFLAAAAAAWILAASAMAWVSGGCDGDLLLDLHRSSFLSPVSHHFDFDIFPNHFKPNIILNPT
jgi:hypothetical protein